MAKRRQRKSRRRTNILASKQEKLKCVQRWSSVGIARGRREVGGAGKPAPAAKPRGIVAHVEGLGFMACRRESKPALMAD
jgi:hypothetical protein